MSDRPTFLIIYTTLNQMNKNNEKHVHSNNLSKSYNNLLNILPNTTLSLVIGCLSHHEFIFNVSSVCNKFRTLCGTFSTLHLRDCDLLYIKNILKRLIIMQVKYIIIDEAACVCDYHLKE